MSSIGENLRRARERAVMTQGELAEAAQLNRSSISQIETGHKLPRPSTIRRLAHALGISPGSLIETEKDAAQA